MLTVVGGIGYVSGALFGGLMAGAGVVASRGHVQQPGRRVRRPRQHLLDAGQRLPRPHRPGRDGCRREPQRAGSLGHRDLAQDRAGPAVLVGAAALEAVFYLLALFDVIGNWWFAALTVLLYANTPRIARTLMPHAVLSPEELAAPRPVPLERVGL